MSRLDPLRRTAAAVAFLAFALGLPLAPSARAQASVTTYHNDAARTGLNPFETTLTPAVVAATGGPTRFGRLFTIPLDGMVYAQPLYLPHVLIPGRGIHNVVYVATEHDSVCAFDGDSGSSLWRRRLTQYAGFAPGRVTPMPWQDVTTSPDIAPEVGITGTPVIDPNSGCLFVVHKIRQVCRFLSRSAPALVSYHQYLDVLDVHTGVVRASVEIRGAVLGSGESGDGNGHVLFDARMQNQRGALLLIQGVVYVTFGAHADTPPFHGWVFGYNARTLRLTGAFCTTPNAVTSGADLAGGGIWMAGGGPAADAFGLYLMTGNGVFDAASGGRDYGDTVLHLRLGNLAVADYFTPRNEKDLDQGDADLGSGGVLLLPPQAGPHPNLLIGCGKADTAYLMDRSALGGFHAESDDVLQTVPGAERGGAYSTPAYFHGHVYVAGARDVLKSYPLFKGSLGTTPLCGPDTFGYSGATPSVSSNGETDGIVWVVTSTTLSEPGLNGPGTLRAYDAETLAPLYVGGSADQVDHYVKFSVPTVANGKVYVGGQTGLTVYGLLAAGP